MSNETVTYSLESVLKEIKDSIKDVNQKMDTLQRDVNDLKVGQAKLTEKVEGEQVSFAEEYAGDR
jgi:uncharacterized protein YoxC